jgi:hypothetical protein
LTKLSISEAEFITPLKEGMPFFPKDIISKILDLSSLEVVRFAAPEAPKSPFSPWHEAQF